MPRDVEGVGPHEHLARDGAMPAVAVGELGALFVLPFQVEAERHEFPPLVGPGSPGVFVGHAEGLEADRPVLERSLTEQPAPEPVAACFDRPSPGRVELMMAKGDQWVVERLTAHPDPAPRRPLGRYQREPQIARHVTRYEGEVPGLLPIRLAERDVGALVAGLYHDVSVLPGPAARIPWRMRRQGPRGRGRQPPGWYRDPVDRRFMRHWNGRSWGRSVRPLPSWAAGGVPLVDTQRAARAQAQARRRAAMLLGAGSFFAFLAAVAAYATVAGTGGLPDAPRVRDDEFLSLAAAACNDAADDIADIPRPEAGDSPARTARYVERVADRYDELIGDLAVLPVAATSEDAVRDWTTSFAAYTAAGRRYSEALRAGGGRGGADAVRREGNQYKRELLAFAFENRLPETCVPT